jgi:predicted nucleotidyltransferase component of viral defense system
MKFDAAQITRHARDTGFLANLEKVPRLRELPIELHKHPFLKGKLVLKGGTALNLFYLGLARLSVDIDLNYIAPVGRDATLRERPDIIKAVEQVASGLGYKLQNGNREEAYLEAIANGRYRPELLFPKDPEIIERIRQHPALLSKADNVARHVSRSRKHS